MRRFMFAALLCLAPAIGYGQPFNVPAPFLLPNRAVSGPVVYTGPGDIVSTWTMWFGSRAYSSATRGNKIWNMCEPTNTTCADISTSATTGYPVVGTIGATNCGSSTTCTIKTWYDLTGNGNDRTQTTAANRFTYNATALNGNACGVAAGSVTGYPTSSAGGTDIVQPYTVSFVAERTGSLTTVQYIMSSTSSGNFDAQINFAGTAAIQSYSGQGANFIQVSAADNAPHTTLAVLNTTSSKLSIDGATAATGDTGTAPTSTNMGIGKNPANPGNNLVGVFCEGGVAPSAVSAQTTALYSNQHTAYGF